MPRQCVDAASGQLAWLCTHPLLVQFQELLRDLGGVEGQP